MENGIIFLFAVMMIICFVIIFGFLVRLQTLLTATQTALAQSQQEIVAVRRALTATNVQGQWGKIQLRRIVELAGMLPYCDFDTQSTFTGINGSQRLDLLVRLSNGRTIVVDAKSPIDTYIQAHASSDDTIHIAQLRKYAANIRSHVTKLAKKEYWRNFEPSPEWVVLFIPNEGMFRAAVEHDPLLLDQAMQQHVFLASPVTLIALLKAMAHGWQQENRANSVHLLIKYSDTLQQQLKAFIVQWRKLHGQLSGSVVAFNQFTATYQITILPVIQQICDLDEIINAEEYDLFADHGYTGPLIAWIKEHLGWDTEIVPHAHNTSHSDWEFIDGQPVKITKPKGGFKVQRKR